jgi:multiple sugar transport system permease protein
MAALTTHGPAAERPAPRRPLRKHVRTIGFHTGASALAALWLLPIALVVVISLRTFDDVLANGLGNWPHSLTLSTYAQAWSGGGMQQALISSLIVTVPGVGLTLFLGSMAAYALSRYQIPLRRTLILLMLGGNLLRSIPSEIQQAALLDGAGPFGIYWRIVLPLTRPALAALGALAFTWIFNDLLWPITVLITESKMPVTPALLTLQGQFVSQWNVIAAGSVIAAVPTVAVFLRFQRHFIAGLHLGAVK